jgi:hypothetical protein
MPGNKPPFRAYMVGSLLRPEPLEEAPAKRAAGEITADQLRAGEGRELDKTRARRAGALLVEVAREEKDLEEVLQEAVRGAAPAPQAREAAA